MFVAGPNKHDILFDRSGAGKSNISGHPHPGRFQTSINRSSNIEKPDLKVGRERFSMYYNQLESSFFGGCATIMEPSNPNAATRTPGGKCRISKQVVWYKCDVSEAPQKGIRSVCHELFLIFTAPSHGCKGVLYCTTLNRNRTLRASSR